MLQIYFVLQKGCESILYYRSFTNLFYITEMLQIYFILQKCCEFIFIIEELQNYFY